MKFIISIVPETVKPKQLHSLCITTVALNLAGDDYYQTGLDKRHSVAT